MSAKAKMMPGDHRANQLQKQLDGHRRVIQDLQEALRIERNRADHAESRAQGAEIAFDLACWVAQQVLEQHPDSMAVSCWRHRYPGILIRREE